MNFFASEGLRKEAKHSLSINVSKVLHQNDQASPNNSISVISNSTNYLTYEGLPWIVLAWIGLFSSEFIRKLTHEIGHLIPALLLTKNEISIRVGEQGSKWKGRFLNIIWEFNFKIATKDLPDTKNF